MNKKERTKLQTLFEMSAIHKKSTMFREIVEVKFYFNNYLGLKIILFGYGFTIAIKVFSPGFRYPFQWIWFKKITK
jgi:hypothetical protein